MTYQVLARKWRPRQFDQMVGQAHVLRALVNALDTHRLHHAYLFTGTRGVGKTTVARIFAKALVCERGIGATPCGECPNCKEIDEGRFLDLIEIDAASRTRVEETRELLENVPYAPSRGRFKVYLIDEVHMFSNHSFNALLKTLEEPPPHVKFLLATTEPKKLPATILSRCLQFSLKRIGAELIESQLERILAREQIPSDPRSRRLLAQAADGSLRDALSLLDQAIAYGGGELREDEVGAMLGTVDSNHVLKLLQRLAGRDASAILAEIDVMAEASPDFQAVLGELLSLLHRIAVYQLLPAHDRTDAAEGLIDLASVMTPEDCQLFYQIALIGRRDLPLIPDPRQGFEMVMLRMLAFSPEDGSAESRQARVGQPPDDRVLAGALGGRELDAGPNGRDWTSLIDDLALSGPVRELASNCVCQGLKGNEIHLIVPPRLRHIRSEKTEARLEHILRTRYRNDLRLVISVADPAGSATPAEAQASVQRERHAAARRAIEQDANVQALRSAFGAEVDPGSIRPVSPA